MSNKAFISSAVLHGIVLTLMAMDFSFAKFDNPPPPPAILMVDLSKVKISDKTNLPPKATVKPKKEAPKPVSKPTPPQPTKTVKTQVQPPPPPRPAPVPPAKNAAPVVEPPKKEAKKEESKKTTTKTEPPPKTETKPSAEDRLKNLLASVDKVKRAAPVAQTAAEPKEMQINEGIEGGTEGSLSQILTISERDLIASRLSACWNLDAGKKDIENIIIEIRAYVNKDGSVREVEILNKMLSAVHQSVAESARRAILVCDKEGDKSPFKILAEKYADHYGDWKSMTLRFNPMTGGIM